MKEKNIVLMVVLVLAVFAGSALALGPLGKPAAGLSQGQWRLGGEYGRGDMDGEVDFGVLDLDFDNVDSDTFQGRLGYGMCDAWELYGLVGAGKAESGDYGITYGVGSKVTFAQEETLSWGALLQIDWFNSDDVEVFEGIEGDLDVYEIIVAVGPTYSVSDTVRIYGGPLFYMLEGDLDIGPFSFDTEIDPQLGGYIGAEFDIDTNAEVFIDFVFADDITMVGGGISWKM